MNGILTVRALCQHAVNREVTGSHLCKSEEVYFWVQGQVVVQAASEERYREGTRHSVASRCLYRLPLAIVGCK